MPIYRCTQCNHRFAVEDPKNAHCPQCKLEGELHTNDMLSERVAERDREIAELRRQLASLRPSPPPDHGVSGNKNTPGDAKAGRLNTDAQRASVGCDAEGAEQTAYNTSSAPPLTLADAVPCGQVLVAIEAVDRKFCDMLANWTWIPNGDVDEKDAPYADTCPVCRGGGIKQTAEDFDNCDCSDGWVVGRKFDEAKLREMAEAATLAMSRPPRGPLTGAEKEWLLWLEDGDKERYGDAHLAAELRSRRDDPTVDLRERYRDACEAEIEALRAWKVHPVDSIAVADARLSSAMGVTIAAKLALDAAKGDA